MKFDLSKTREEELPMITFALFAYNQEEFIKAAVEGVLAQSYGNLEIILSDDCSTDQTFEIMQDMVAKYKGKHRVLLKKNTTNLGLCGHINEVMKSVKSEWVIIAAGDDISYDFRVEETKKAIDLHPNACSIYFNTDYLRDDKDNNTNFIPDTSTHDIKRMIESGGAKVFGPSHAWNMKVFSVFGSLPEDAISEDRVIPFRSALLGEIVYVDKKVLQYRLHFSSISTLGNKSLNHIEYKKYRLRQIKRLSAIFNSFKTDLEIAKNKKLLKQSKYTQYKKAIYHEKRQLDLYLVAWSGTFIKRPWAAIMILLRPSRFTGDGFKQRFFLLLDAFCPFLDALYHKYIRNRRNA